MSGLFDHMTTKQNKKKLVSSLLFIFCIFQDYSILFSLKPKEHSQEGRSADGKVVVVGTRRCSEGQNEREGENCQDGE